jgi:hypothetical protein
MGHTGVADVFGLEDKSTSGSCLCELTRFTSGSLSFTGIRSDSLGLLKHCRSPSHFHAVDVDDTGALVGAASSSGVNSTVILSKLDCIRLTRSRSGRNYSIAFKSPCGKERKINKRRHWLFKAPYTQPILVPPFPSTFRAML